MIWEAMINKKAYVKELRGLAERILDCRQILGPQAERLTQIVAILDDYLATIKEITDYLEGPHSIPDMNEYISATWTKVESMAREFIEICAELGTGGGKT